MMDGLTWIEEQRLKKLEREREVNERRHREIVMEIAVLMKKKLGQAYPFQNSHEAT